MVGTAVENRDVSQDSQVGLPCRRSETSHRGAFDEVDRSFLHFDLAGILDDDAAKNRP